MMVERDGLHAEVWQRENGSWVYVVCPGTEDPAVLHSIQNLRWEWMPEVPFYRVEDGIRDREKRWWQRGDDFGTGEERAVRKARIALGLLAEDIEHERREEQRRKEAQAVTL